MKNILLNWILACFDIQSVLNALSTVDQYDQRCHPHFSSIFAFLSSAAL
jgi:hypothetical protein